MFIPTSFLRYEIERKNSSLPFISSYQPIIVHVNLYTLVSNATDLGVSSVDQIEHF